MELMKKFKRYKSIRKTNFEEVSQKWLEMKKNSIKESTYYNYMFIIDKYLIPTFSQISLKKLSEYNYNNFIEDLKIRLSAKTIRDILNVLKSILKYSQDEYEYSINMRTIISPKLNIQKIKILNKKEKGRLERYCLKKENTLYKRHAVLLKTFDNHYIDLEQLNWLLTLRINHKIPFTPKSALLTTIPLEENQIYVDSSSITPYLSAKTNVNLKIVRKWQKQAK